MGKQTKSSFKLKTHISSNRPLRLLHLDLFRPTRTNGLGKQYAFVVIDELLGYLSLPQKMRP